MSAFVIAVKHTWNGPVEFRAVRLDGCSLHTLAFDALDNVAEFATYEEAASLVDLYNDGPGEDIRRARWCSSRPYGWEDLGAIFEDA